MKYPLLFYFEWADFKVVLETPPAPEMVLAVVDLTVLFLKSFYFV